MALLPIGLGCDGSRPSEPEASAGLKYLFEVELEQHRSHWLGLAVQADGTVYQYDRTGEAPGPCDHYWAWVIADDCKGKTLTEAQLTVRYSRGQSLLTEIPRDELARRIEQATRVADGPLRTPNRACNDFGVLSLVAFEAARGRYLPRVVRLEGDQMRQNLSPGAVELTPWLLELAEKVPAVRAWRGGSRDCRPD